MTVPEARRHPVLRRYALRRHRIHVKGRTLSIVSPASMDALLAQLDDDEFRARGERLPYWAEVWASSVALARLLHKGPSLRGMRVLDLGCGVGLAGTAAYALGAGVDFADVEPDALEFARFNALKNPPSGGPPGRLGVRRLDWCETQPAETWDRILIADGVYEEPNQEPILRFVARHGGTAWIADPGREPADPFFARLEAPPKIHPTCFGDRRVQVRIGRVTAAEVLRRGPRSAPVSR